MITPRFTPPVTEEQAARAGERVGRAFVGLRETFQRASERIQSPGPFAERLAEAMRPLTDAGRELRSGADVDAEGGAQ